MKYIENDGQVTREYEVKINTNELQQIIKELEEKCYRVVDKRTKVAANNEKEATDKLSAMDKDKIKVKQLTDISDKYPGEITNFGLAIFDCEYLCRQNTYLVYVLETILSNYRSSLSFKNQNSHFLDVLVRYENSIELKPYTERLKWYKEELLKNSDNAAYTKKLEDDVAITMREMEYNKDYDFALLNELYRRAKECFNLILVAETVHYKDIDKNPKVYKLGTQKNI